MPSPEIVAHRGATEWAPENTLVAFEKAIELAAGCIEMDVRLSADRVPVVFHYFYLNLIPGLEGVVFNYTARQLQEMSAAAGRPIPLLDEVLQAVGDRIGLEIEIKGPEPESAGIVAGLLAGYRHLWPSIEVTSYEPALLQQIGSLCPGLAVDLLFPRPETWMGPEVVAYTAIHRARLAGARAVHLHPAQLDDSVAAAVCAAGLAIHAWDVNDEPALNKVLALGIPRLCTDRLEWALKTREMMTP